MICATYLLVIRFVFGVTNRILRVDHFEVLLEVIKQVSQISQNIKYHKLTVYNRQCFYTPVHLSQIHCITDKVCIYQCNLNNSLSVSFHSNTNSLYSIEL